MRGPAVRPIVIAAGGTGGHFFPAEALAEVLVARGRRVVLMTDARTASRRSDVFDGRERLVIRGAGIAGRGLARGAQAVAALAAGMIEARRALGLLDAAAVVGFGGYPSVAPVLAARALGRRRPAIVLHEQNAVLGRANRFLARRADLLALGFAETAGVPGGVRSVVTGNPVRAPILAAAGLGPAAGGTLLVLGGSLGARVFSDVVPAAVALLPAALRPPIVQQCRAEDIERVRDAYARIGIVAELATFFAEVGDRLAGAAVVIARAGASTVAELALIGRPAILVPLPQAIDDHQTVNARALAACGGAVLMTQPAFTAEALAQQLAELLAAPDRLAAMGARAQSAGRADAAERLADLVEQHMRAEVIPASRKRITT